MSETKKFHPVDLDVEKCKGCINCMKRCPVEAIRVRDGVAKVNYDSCMGCGECVRICTHRAKRAVYDSYETIHNYKYKIALVPPSLYGQFNNLEDIDYILNGLKVLGFDDVFEVAKGAELVSLVTRKVLAKKPSKPVISSACPAICELIESRFRSLRGNILRVLSPVEVSAKLALERAMRDGDLAREDIGVFFISPCPAKVSALKEHSTTEEKYVDGILAVNDIYFKLLQVMKEIKDLEPIKGSGIIGIGWATIGGEASGALSEHYLSADGIDNCISVLKELENAQLEGLEFIELNACPSGCVGGVLNIENPFVAKSKLKKLRKYLPVMKNKLEDYDKPIEFYLWDKMPEAQNSLKMGEDISSAFEIMARIEEIEKSLPMLDCGACGAPSCRAFAEDVALGLVSIDDCNRRVK